MNRIRAVIVSAIALVPLGAPAAQGASRGEAYIIRRETGGQAKYKRDRTPHPGPSSASGPYGLLAGTRSDYHCGNVSDRECATRYMLKRYGSWEKAAAYHRRIGHW